MTHTGGSATREVANVKAGNLVLGDRHSIVSSARIKIESGTSIPSAVAVLPLTTNSNFVGRMTGSSAGVAPLRMLRHRHPLDDTFHPGATPLTAAT